MVLILFTVVCVCVCVLNEIKLNKHSKTSFSFVTELIGEHRVEIPLFRTEEGRYLATSKFLL